MQSTHVLLDIRASVAFITLNRPEVLNALHLEMARDLMSAVMTCDGHPDVRAVVLTGTGSAFCAEGTSKASLPRVSSYRRI